MEHFYCPKCERGLKKSEIYSRLDSLAQQDRDSVNFYNFSDYYCRKHLIKIKKIDQSTKNQNGFIQIPLLITLIIGFVALSGGVYFGVRQYTNYQIEKEKLNLEVEKLRAEKANTELKSKEQSNKGTINKASSTPKIIPVNTVTPQPSQSIQLSLSAIIKQWRPIVASIECQVNDNDGRVLAKWGGSGILQGYTSSWLGGTGAGYVILTNKHVLAVPYLNKEYAPSFCQVRFPDSSFISVSDPKINGNPNQDIATLLITNPNTYLTNIKTRPIDCVGRAEIGEKVLILGYPGIGSQGDITATEGIISGYDGIYDITSAKIDHGNSGGVAILTDKNCYIGIPSYATTGSIESLGRILDLPALKAIYQ